MARMTTQGRRIDPYMGYKFRVLFEGVVVAGVSKATALKRTQEVIEHRSGGDPSTPYKMPGIAKFEPLTLERGVTHSVEFEQWANKAWNLRNGVGAELSGDFRKNIQLEIFNEAGQLALRYNIFNCWVSEFQQTPDLDASAAAVMVESIKIEHEGFERDYEVAAPVEPEFSIPAN